MHAPFILTIAFLLSSADGFPWLADGFERNREYPTGSTQRVLKPKQQDNCLYGLDKPEGAAPYDSKFPYTGAQNGSPGTGRGLVKVPANGDKMHAYEAPGPNDQRGPCPGLNTAANHHFISHNGITTHDEIVTGLQNLYNVGYDFASFAATLGISQVGNITSETLSIGDCGLSTHGAIEGDTSLTRSDLAISPDGDSHSFNVTLFKHMADTCSGTFNQANMARYRALRYDESRATNPQFFFGPKALLIFGASSFLYELMASYDDESTRGDTNLETIASFFGAARDSSGCHESDSGESVVYKNVHEQIPSNYVNRPTPYTLHDFASNALHTYLRHPRELGENLGEVGKWAQVGDFGIVKNGWIDERTTDGEAFCHLWKVVAEGVPGPGGKGGVLEDKEVKDWVKGKMEKLFEGAGCF